jgi:hypothetical protein
MLQVLLSLQRPQDGLFVMEMVGRSQKLERIPKKAAIPQSTTLKCRDTPMNG